MRPNDWKMKATVPRRSITRSRSVIAVTSWPATCTVPPVGPSSPPMTLSSVVLPEPDRPRTATSWPSPTVSETPRSACTAVSPLPKVRDTSRAATMTAPRPAAGPAGAGASALLIGPALARGVHVGPYADVVRLALPAGPGWPCRGARSSRGAAGPARPGPCTAYSTVWWVVSPSSPAAACRRVSLLVRPSRIAIVRRTCADTAGSWVTTRMVAPSSLLAVCRAANTSRGSRCPARRSARRRAAPAADWPAPSRWPCAAARRRTSSPACGRSSGPRRVSPRSWLARRSRSRLPTRLKLIGIMTFCRPVRYGSRLREACCHRNPTTERR